MQVIRVENLSKLYYLGSGRRHNSLRDAVMSFVRQPSLAAREKQELWALKDLNFAVGDGETLGIIGHNGAGKSTLLKILSRITKPTRGTAEIRGRVASLLEVGTGFHSELSGRENIFLNGAILGMRRGEIERKFDEIVAFAEIEKFIDTPVKFYSSGMYMRLAFAVAAHLEPEVLIVDEVLAVGDMAFQKKCLGKMDEVSKSGRTVLFVSHNLGSLAQICRKGLLLHKGELLAHGGIEETVSRYLDFAQSEKQFKAKELSEHKNMQFTEAFVANKDGLITNVLPHDEEFVLEFKVKIRQLVKGATYCIALLNKYKERVFSEYRNVEEFPPPPDAEREIHFRYKVPKDFVAPNDYSFRLEIFQSTGEFLDLLPDVCPFSVIDTGSELSKYKNYGYVQIKSDWKTVG
ncbi:MAG: ABC transporter ATP-binding protein [Acidobacteriota bacterium]|nr:ABC transporter ATP-binding protein [Acidobacteriota bacterium]